MNPILELYHGTTIEFVPPFKQQPTFLAHSYDFAYNHACLNNCPKPMVLKCALDTNVVKLFDPRTAARELLGDLLPTDLELNVYGRKMKMDKRFFLRQLELFTNDVWRYLECKLILQSIQQLGFGGHIAKEDNQETICIYNPKQIQIVEYLEGMTWKEYTDKY